jgi:hypothetical protein
MDHYLFIARRDELLLQEAAQPQPGLWWLSYLDPSIRAEIPEDEQRLGGRSFLGVVIVEANGAVSAGVKSSQLGANPGDEARIYGPFPLGTFLREYHNRLLDHEEAHAAEGLGA